MRESNKSFWSNGIGNFLRSLIAKFRIGGSERKLKMETSSNNEESDMAFSVSPLTESESEQVQNMEQKVQNVCAKVAPHLSSKIEYRYAKISEALAATKEGSSHTMFICPDYGRVLMIDSKGFLCSSVSDDDKITFTIPGPPFSIQIETTLYGITNWLDSIEMLSTYSKEEIRQWEEKGIEFAKAILTVMDSPLYNGILFYIKPYEDEEARNDAPVLINLDLWKKKALESQDELSINNLFYCYSNGIMVEKDQEEADRWLRILEDAGNASTQHTLVTIGTIGPVDHGKTTLTCAITRVLAKKGLLANYWSYDMLDNSPEEKERGITIDTHAIEYKTESRRYTHLDCPGHPDYISETSKAISQLDGAILVISATEGIGPQAIEYVRLAQEHHVPALIVFINKCDIIDDFEAVDQLEKDIRIIISEYGFDGVNTPVIKGSALGALNGIPEDEMGVRKLVDEIDNVKEKHSEIFAEEREFMCCPAGVEAIDSEDFSKINPKPKATRNDALWFDETTKELRFDGYIYKFIDVEGGSFQMGASSNDSEAWNEEKPQHEVTLDSFAIGETQVTQALWKAVVLAWKNDLEQKGLHESDDYISLKEDPSKFKGANRPVECVSWNDCKEFIRRLNLLTGQNFGLPTEAEWEYAARGGKHKDNYKYSGSNNIDEVAWYDLYDGETHPVKLKKCNGLGLYDMSGNVWEWCEDWCENSYAPSYYSVSNYNNPKGPSSGTFRIYRGSGAFYDDARFCRVSCRYAALHNDSCCGLGLRLVLHH